MESDKGKGAQRPTVASKELPTNSGKDPVDDVTIIRQHYDEMDEPPERSFLRKNRVEPQIDKEYCPRDGTISQATEADGETKKRKKHHHHHHHHHHHRHGRHNDGRRHRSVDNALEGNPLAGEIAETSEDIRASREKRSKKHCRHCTVADGKIDGLLQLADETAAGETGMEDGCVNPSDEDGKKHRHHYLHHHHHRRHRHHHRRHRSADVGNGSGTEGDYSDAKRSRSNWRRGVDDEEQLRAVAAIDGGL